MAQVLTRFIQFVRTSTDTLQCLESLISALEILGRFPPIVLAWIKPVISIFQLEASNISLRYEYDRSSSDLNKIGYHVMQLIDILQSLSEMADDEDRLLKIFDEVMNQKVTHFDRQDITRFPELNDFLTELIARIDKANTLSNTIEIRCKELSTRNEAAQTKASNQENAAKWIKHVLGTVKVSFPIAAGVMCLVAVTGKVPAVLGAVSIGVGSTGICLSQMAFEEYSQREEKFRSTKEEFMVLNQAAGRLQDIATQNLFPAQAIEIELNVNFTRENVPNQPPLLTRIKVSLDKLLKALKFERRNLCEMRKEAEIIADATKVEFQLMPRRGISCAEPIDHTATYSIKSDDILSTDIQYILQAKSPHRNGKKY